jgi:hypothetical protein
MPTVGTAGWWYVVDAWPFEPVLTGLALKLPQAAPLLEKRTESLITGLPLEFVTVAVITELDAAVPSAGMLVGLALTVTPAACPK